MKMEQVNFQEKKEGLVKTLRPPKDSIQVNLDREYACQNLLYDTSGCRGFLKKYPEKAGLFEMMTGATYMRYFLLDLKK